MDSTGDFYVYLTSTSSELHYPNNNASEFINDLNPPICLDEDYEIALVNIFFPKQFYSLSTRDEESGIKFETEFIEHRHDVNSRRHKRTVFYRPQTNLREIKRDKFMRKFENDIREFLIKENFMVDSPGGKLFTYDKKNNQLKFNKIQPVESENGFENSDTTIVFGEVVAEILGVTPGVNYSAEVLQEIYKPDKVKKLAGVSDVSVLFVHTDIIHSSHKGDTQANILDVLPIDNAFSKNNTPLIYKQLRQRFISSIDLSMKDQGGQPAPFVNSVNCTAILHFRRCLH